ncbi:hypothetical protein E3U23_11310 [Erythrobacter litoralis]|uniref:hypothetical protein n=1 Tax=Erythrobacter litoralis TaxID=39960 RepID=UPI0024350CD6|nr:hypothetical protein [Erythrobacter litoralis]MDG6079777.1 hypothetical protein [Erythrobacter litoralis]
MKPRAPLSTDQALARIAGQLPGSYAEMAERTGRSESHVRKWGDPDCREMIPLDHAITLDLAFQEAGGNGCPLHDSYTARLEVAAAAKFAEQFTLLTHAEGLSKEAGEALHALLRACQPDAGLHERRLALKEVVDVAEQLRPIIAALNCDGARSAEQSGQSP